MKGAARNSHRTLVLAVFMVFVGLVLGALLQRQQSQLRHLVTINQAAITQNCEIHRVAVLRTNNTWTVLSAIDDTNAGISPEVLAQRKAAYQAAMLVVPYCGK